MITFRLLFLTMQKYNRYGHAANISAETCRSCWDNRPPIETNEAKSMFFCPKHTRKLAGLRKKH